MTSFISSKKICFCRKCTFVAITWTIGLNGQHVMRCLSIMIFKLKWVNCIILFYLTLQNRTMHSFYCIYLYCLYILILFLMKSSLFKIYSFVYMKSTLHSIRSFISVSTVKPESFMATNCFLFMPICKWVNFSMIKPQIGDFLTCLSIPL
jgi:hypothetical protein